MARSGFQRRKERVAAGLPRYSPGEAVSRRKNDLMRAERRRYAFFARIGRIKTEAGCADCGYSAHPAALHFDHLPGFVKCDGIAAMWCRPWSAVVAEMAKCEVVCANCHAVRTVERRLAS